MARRVNTKFVVGLGSVLIVGAGGTLAFWAVSSWYGNDPTRLIKEGDAAVARGDMEEAVKDYEKAANSSSLSHRPGTAELYDKAGDLAMKASNQTADPVDSSKYYVAAQDAWRRALTENAYYLPARKKLVEEQYKVANFDRSSASWTTLQETASKLVKLDPTYGHAYTYLAAARFDLMPTSRSEPLDPDQLKLVDSAIGEAMKADPSSPTPWVLRANLLQLEASRLARSDVKGVKKLMDSAAAELRTFLAKNPNDADASLMLATLEWQSKKSDEAVKILEGALAAHPKEVRLASLLADLDSRLKLTTKAEKVLKTLVSGSPDNNEGYLALARYYQSRHESASAIDAYKNALKHPAPGGGIIPLRNISAQVECFFNISWLYMDIAEASSRAHAAADYKAALAQAKDYAAKLRSSRSLKQSQDLIEGRLQLLSGNTRDAITALLNADRVYGKGSANAPQWLQTKAVLSQAYEMNTDWGTALNYLNEILVQFPNQPTVMLQKAQVLCRIAQWKEALTLVEPFVNAGPDSHVPAEMQNQAMDITAQAYRGLGLTKQYEELERRRGGTSAQLAIASTRLRDNDLQGALDEVTTALKAAPDNEGALVLALVINLRMEKHEEAAAILKKAIGLYPKNTQLQVIQVLLSNPKGDPQKMQLAALGAITDPFTQHMAKAQYYGQMRDVDKEIAEVVAAEKIMEDNGNSQSKEAISQLNDKIFSLNMGAAEESRAAGTAAQERADHAANAADKAAALKEKTQDEANYKRYWGQTELYAQKAERLNLDGVGGKLYRGRLQFATGPGSRSLGIETLRHAVADSPTSSVGHTVLGQAYFMDRSANNGYAEKALAEFRLAIEEKPDNVPALKFAIDLLLQKPSPQTISEAQGYLKQALAFSPRDPQLQHYSDQLSDPAEQIRKREVIRKENPGDLNNIRSLAVLYVRVGDPLKAVGLLRIIQKKYPKDLALADTMAKLLHEGHKDNDALVMYEPFIGSNDPAVRYRATLMEGDLYKLLNKPDEAIATYKSAIPMQVGNDDAQRRLADLYFDLDKMKDAEATYHDIYNAEKDKDVKVLRRLVESMLRQDEFAPAEAMIHTLLAAHPDDPDGWILQGFSQFRQHKPKEAIACFDHVLKDHPDNLDALHYRAFTAYSSPGGDLAQATKDLQAVKEADPKRVNSRILLAKVYRMTHHFAQAAEEYSDVIQLEPDVPAYRVEYGEYLLAVADVLKRLSPDNQEDFARDIRAVRAVDRLQRLLAESAGRFPDQPIWLVLQGNLLVLQGNTADGTQKYLEAFQKSGENPQMAGTYLNALVNSRRYEDVVTLVNHLLEKYPNYGDYFVKRGVAYGKMGKTDESLADFSHALDLAGKNLDLYLAVVRQAESAVPAPALVKLLDGRLKAAPGDAETLLGLGDVYLMNKDGANAVKVLAQVPSDPKAVYQVLALRMTGMAKLMIHDTQGAYEAYMAVLKISPDDVEVMNNLAFMLADDMHRPKEALPYAERAAKIIQSGKVDIAFVNNGNVYDTLGWVKFLMGDVQGAVIELKRAQEIEPTPIVYLHLAKALKKGDLSGSRSAVAEGIRLATQTKDPVLPQLETLRKQIGVE